MLLQAASLGHAALPHVLNGGYEDRESVVDAGFDLDGFAFVMTRGGTAPLSDEENVHSRTWGRTPSTRFGT